MSTFNKYVEIRFYAFNYGKFEIVEHKLLRVFYDLQIIHKYLT